MAEYVEIFKDGTGQWRWRRRGANGRVMSQGESHKRRWNAKRAARRDNPGLPIFVVR